MAPIPIDLREILSRLRVTRSVQRTARELRLPEDRVRQAASMAFGLGVLEENLVDY